MTDTKNLLIGVLLIAVTILGVSYYQSRQNTIEITLPKIK
jgi:predicted negative regulator of RcsB-dependent stress response